ANADPGAATAGAAIPGPRRLPGHAVARPGGAQGLHGLLARRPRLVARDRDGRAVRGGERRAVDGSAHGRGPAGGRPGGALAAVRAARGVRLRGDRVPGAGVLADRGPGLAKRAEAL